MPIAIRYITIINAAYMQKAPLQNIYNEAFIMCFQS